MVNLEGHMLDSVTTPRCVWWNRVPTRRFRRWRSRWLHDSQVLPVPEPTETLNATSSRQNNRHVRTMLPKSFNNSYRKCVFYQLLKLLSFVSYVGQPVRQIRKPLPQHETTCKALLILWALFLRIKKQEGNWLCMSGRLCYAPTEPGELLPTASSL